MSTDGGGTSCNGFYSENCFCTTGDVELDFGGRIAGQEGRDDGFLVEIASAEGIVEAVGKALAGIFATEESV